MRSQNYTKWNSFLIRIQNVLTRFWNKIYFFSRLKYIMKTIKYKITYKLLENILANLINSSLFSMLSLWLNKLMKYCPRLTQIIKERSQNYTISYWGANLLVLQEETVLNTNVIIGFMYFLIQILDLINFLIFNNFFLI